MNKRALSLLAVFALAFTCVEFGLPQGPAPVYAAKKPSVSKPVSKLLEEAQKLEKEGNWADALAKAKEAQALPDKTPYDDFTINEILAGIYINTQDYTNAGIVYEAAWKSGFVPPEEKGTFLNALAQIFYATKDYTKALSYADQYFKEVGDNLDLLAIVANIYLIQKDTTKALASAQDLISKANLTDTKIKEPWWRLLLYAANDAKNENKVKTALFGLVENYSNANNWNDLARYFSSLPKRTDHYGLLAFRLMQAADAMKNGDDYLYLAQFALNVGLPEEARQALEAGKAKGLLPGGESTKRQYTSLIEQATASAKKEAASLDGDDTKAAASASGASNVAIGEAEAVYGKTDKAIAAIKRGLAMPTLKTKGEAHMALGWVYFRAGQYDQAKAAFEAVVGEPRDTDLAKAWLILIKHKTSPVPASSGTP